MSAAYWKQWDHADLMSWQGKDEFDTDLRRDELDEDLCQDEIEEQGCCSNVCMDCLGLSWKDFM